MLKKPLRAIPAALLLIAFFVCAVPAPVRADDAGTVAIAGMSISRDATELDLNGRPVDKTELEMALHELPALTRADLRGTGYGARALTTLMESYPHIAFTADIELFGVTYATTDTALDLRGAAVPDPDRLFDALGYFPDLAEVNLSGLSVQPTRMAQLLAAYPDVHFIWDVELLPGLTVSTAETSLDLRGYTVSDIADFTDKLAYFKNLTYCDMCSCGLNDAQMEALCTAYPAVKFVWIVRIGTSWNMRTDTTGFSAGLTKDFEGIEFTGASYSSYRTVTTETIAPLKYCTDLVALDLGHSFGLNDISVVQYMPKLRFLIFTDTNVVDLSAVATLPALEFLEFFVTRDKDNRRLALIDIEPVTKIKTLRQFNCSQIPNIDIGILEQMTWLERLWIIKCGFSEEEVAEIRAALPNTLVANKGTHGGSNWRAQNPLYIEMQGLMGLPLSWQLPEDVG